MSVLRCVLVLVPVLVTLIGPVVTLKTTEFESLPEKTDYKAAGATYDDGGMAPLFDFARSFINTALPGGFPTEFINETITAFDKGSLDMGSLGLKLLKTFMGYVVAVVVGFLFILIFPLVGLCFCCCRMCGNCGGKRHQEVTEDMQCKRRVYACVLFVISIFTLVGNICTYVSNDRMTVALDKLGGNVDNNLDDIDGYLDLVLKQVTVIGGTNLNITENELLKRLDKDQLKDEISEYVLNALSSGAIDEMQTNIHKAIQAFDAVTNATTDAHSAYNRLSITCNGPGASAGCLGVPTQDPLNSSPEFVSLMGSQKSQFDTFRGNDTVQQVKHQLEEKIAGQLTGLSGQKQQVEKSFAEMRNKTQPIIDQLKEFKTNTQAGMDVKSIKKTVDSYASQAQEYDKYRHSVAVGLCAITTLVVTLQIFGLVFGFVGQGNDTAPSERGCVSNSGGNMLIASVAFVFIFGALLMLLTTICFSIGAILERFVCQPLSDPELSLLKVAGRQFDTKSYLHAELPDVMKACRNNEAAYTAFNLVHKFNISQIDDKLKASEQDIKAQMNIALQNIASITSGGNTFDFANTATHSLDLLESSLNGIQFTPVINQLNTVISGMGAIRDPVTQEYLAAMTSLKNAVTDLENIKNVVGDWKSSFVVGMGKAKNDISVKLTGLVHNFTTEIVGIVHHYVDTTKTAVVNNMGRCGPIWNLYNSVVVISVCQYTIDAFNGFWFSIGWCLFFFIPGIVFSVKLAKHYRTTDVDEEGQPIQREDSVAYGNPMFRSNKISHLDNAPITQY